MKTYIKRLIAGAAVLSLFAPILAIAAPFDLQASYRDKFDASDIPLNLTPNTYDDGLYQIPAFLGGGTDGVHPLGSYHFIQAGSGVRIVSGNIFSTVNTIETDDGYLADTIGILKSGVASLVSTVSGLGSPGVPFSISAFMSNSASTTPYVATATTTGGALMSGSMVAKLSQPRSFATSTRSLTASTGATGFQISSTRDAQVSYAMKVTATASIGTPSEGHVVLEISPTNSASAGSWYQVGADCGNGQNVTLAALLTSVQTTYCTVSAMIPAGYYAKLRTITVSDTPTFSYLSGQEVQLPMF